MHRYHIHDNVLYLDDTCLYRSPPTNADATPLECVGVLARFSQSSIVDDNGFCNYHAEALSTMSPLEAVCLLVHLGHVVTIEEWSTEVASGMLRLPVHRPWSPIILVVPVTTCMVDCNEAIHPSTPLDGNGFTIVVAYDEKDVPVVVEETLYHTVVDSSTYVLRVSHNTESVPRVAHYVDRVLVAMQSLPSNAPCGTLLIDERGSRDKFDGGVSMTSLTPLVSAILRSDMVAIVQNSEILCSLMEFVSLRWFTMMRRMWVLGTDDVLLNLLSRTSTPDCIARCIDPVVLFSKRRFVERIDTVGMAIVRRMACCDATRYADIRASMFSHHGVVRFEIFSVNSDRFAQLFRIGVFDGMSACREGVLVNVNNDTTILCVPFDSKTLQIMGAVTTLLLKGETYLSKDCSNTTFAFGVTYNETSSQCPSPETLTPYRLFVDVPNRSLVLVKDVEQKTFKVETIRSVDELEQMVIPCDESRTRRHDVSELFPAMTSRVEKKSSGNVSACLREVQSRRVAREWSLDAMDTGHNMSSLGMSIMLHLLLSQLLGAKCRVAQSRSGAALLAVYMQNDYVFVDPCRTLCNFFTLSQELSLHFSTAGGIPKAGIVVEVRNNTQWLLGVVQSVDVERGTMIVEFAKKSTRKPVSFGGGGWRRVGQDASDTDKTVGYFIRLRKREEEMNKRQRT